MTVWFSLALSLLIAYSLSAQGTEQLVLEPLPASSASNTDSNSHLRRQLFRSYKQSSDSKASPESRLSALTAIIKQSIPSGISFDRAEKILLEAGFRINNDPAHFPPRPGPRAGSATAILTMENANYGIINLAVSLEPVDLAKKHDVIGTIKVSLSATTL